VHRSAGAAAIDSFCAQIGNLGGKPGQINDQQYNVGTVDDLHLTIEFPMGSSTTVFPGDCKQYFYAIIGTFDSMTVVNAALTLFKTDATATTPILP